MSPPVLGWPSPQSKAPEVFITGKVRLVDIGGAFMWSATGIAPLFLTADDAIAALRRRRPTKIPPPPVPIRR